MTRPRERFLHVQLDMRSRPLWDRVRMAFGGRIHVLMHRNGKGEFTVVRVTAVDPTKGAAA